MDPSLSAVRYEVHNSIGGFQRTMYSRPNEEFVADFEIVSRNFLADTPVELEIFRHHFVHGKDWRYCCKRIGIDRGSFFHKVYKIEQDLGTIFVELQPFPLYTVDDYFGIK